MKPFLLFACALGLAAPAAAEPTEDCATPETLREQVSAVYRMLDGLRSRRTNSLAPLVPPGAVVITDHDWYGEPPVPKTVPLDVAYLRRLLSAGSFTVKPSETMPGLMCGSVVVKWWRPGGKDAYLMNTLEFRGGRLAKVEEVDLVELHRRGPPIVVMPTKNP